MTARAIGDRHEDVALAHLERAGLTLIARNVNFRHGELDLVMRDGSGVVFVEVRYRGASRFGDGFDSISASKRARIIRAAQSFLAENPTLANRPCRFDVVALTDSDASPQWMQNAFEVT